MRSFAIYVLAAVAEIAGCYALWAWHRLGKSVLWFGPGVASLILFAFLLTKVDSLYAGRAYGAYGGIYIAASLAFLWIWEDVRPVVWDLVGTAILLVGAAIILFGPRPA